METLFASKAEPGQKYLTAKSNWPLVILGSFRDQVRVRSLTSGNAILISRSDLLQPYDEFKINKEALIVMKQKTGATKTVLPKARMADVEGKKSIKKTYKGKDYMVEIKADGFYFEGVRHNSTTSIAAKITGHPTSGPAFFGLRGGKKS